VFLILVHHTVLFGLVGTEGMVLEFLGGCYCLGGFHRFRIEFLLGILFLIVKDTFHLDCTALHNLHFLTVLGFCLLVLHLIIS
jgi:hypothetical protein